MLAYNPLIAGEVIAVSAVLLSRKLTWMAHKSVPQNSQHKCRQKVECGISLAVVDFSTFYHKLLFYLHCNCKHPLISGSSSFLFVVVLKTI